LAIFAPAIFDQTIFAAANIIKQSRDLTGSAVVAAALRRAIRSAFHVDMM
jgi:hypothetical protein